ncbi:MAG: stage II sporulation protein M [Spirochaetales bacterium]|nr:stage II sporulation protein M [Spirochaetales bacterium]
MKTKSERFVESKRESWKSLGMILGKISHKGIKKLTLHEVESFPSLYRMICQDLAEARMLDLSPDVITYLNNLTGQANSHLYFIRPLTSGDIRSFFKIKLPFAIVENLRYVLIALIFFWGTAIGSYFVVLAKPDLASKVISTTVLDFMEEMYEEPPSSGRSAAERSVMSAYYIQHNTSIAFLCFATGIFLGLGSIYFLLYNGVFMGTIFGYLTAKGLGLHLLEFVTAHSFLELNAIVIAGAAGMMLGMSILKSWRDYSTDCLKKNRSSILLVVAASAIMLLMAALIEGNISPSELDYKYKILTAFSSFIVFTLYFIVTPLYRKRQI